MTEQEAYEDLKWRVENDKPSRDQFERLVIGSGYLCECVCDPTHLHNEIRAEWRRPPMPEKRAKHPYFVCTPCLMKYPATQQ